MLRECRRAMTQSSGSQSSGASPFRKRNSLVAIKARCSGVLASAIDGETGAFEVKLAAPLPVMRRGTDALADPLMSRATGRGANDCADAIEMKTNTVRERLPSARGTIRANVNACRLLRRTLMSKTWRAWQRDCGLRGSGPGGGLLSAGPCRGRKVRNRH